MVRSKSLPQRHTNPSVILSEVSGCRFGLPPEVTTGPTFGSTNGTGTPTAAQLAALVGEAWYLATMQGSPIEPVLDSLMGSYSSPKFGVRTLRDLTPRKDNPSRGSHTSPAFQAVVPPTVL